jgi:hypothetical protein
VDDPGSVCQPGSEQNRALFGFVEKSSHILLIPSVYIYIVYIAYFHIFPKSFYGISVGFLCDFHDISMIFLWDYSNYPWVNGHIDLGNPWLKPFGTWSPNGGLGPFIWVWENGVYLAAIQWIWESYFWPNPDKSCRIDMKNPKPDQKNTYLSASPFPITMWNRYTVSLN